MAQAPGALDVEGLVDLLMGYAHGLIVGVDRRALRDPENPVRLVLWAIFSEMV